MVLSTTRLGDTGSPVAFVHGLFGQGRNWTQIGKQLAGDHRVLLVDMPNHGRSEWVDSIDYLDLADRVAGLFSADDPVALVGHSMGGFLAGFHAGVSSEVLERLVIMEGTGLPGKGPWDDPLRERVTRWLRRRTEVQERPQNSYANVAEAAARLQKIDPTLRPSLAQRLAETEDLDRAYQLRQDLVAKAPAVDH